MAQHTLIVDAGRSNPCVVCWILYLPKHFAARKEAHTYCGRIVEDAEPLQLPDNVTVCPECFRARSNA